MSNQRGSPDNQPHLGRSQLPDDIPLLVEQLKSGQDHPAWAQLRAEIYRLARRYAYRHGTALEDADDITQEITLILLYPGKLDSLGAPQNGPAVQTLTRSLFIAFLAGMTYRVWIARLRYFKRRQHQSLDASPREPDDDDPTTEIDLADPQANVEEQAARRAEIERVYSWLHDRWQQGGRARDTVEQFVGGVIEDHKYAEMARICGCTEGQVRSAVHDIRRRLREFRVQETEFEEEVVRVYLRPPRAFGGEAYHA